MTIRHLDQLLEPQSVAVFGASERPGSVGATVWRNIQSGRFLGPRWPVNPKHTALGGVPCFADADSLPQAPDLAVICTPPATVPQLIAELGARGTRAAIVLSAGFDAVTRQAMLDAARPHLLRILGPNCLGLLVPHIGLNASFAHTGAEAGSLAFVSQSGALVTAMLDWAAGRGIGFSHFVSLGEHADVDFGDMLDWLASCPRTRAILMYAESIEGARKFMSAARAAARNKPVLIVKAGRSALGQAAAASHTGALAASDLVIDAAIRRAGMLRVDTLQDLFDAAETLSHFRGSIAAEVSRAMAAEVVAVETGAKARARTDTRTRTETGAQAGLPASDVASESSGTVAARITAPPPPRATLTLVTNGGGAGVMAADAAAAAGVPLAHLFDATLKRLDEGLPANWSRGNPVDIIGDAPVARYVHTLRTLLDAPEAGTLLFMHAPTAIVPSTEIARAIAPLAAEPGARGRLLASWLGGPGVAQARRCFEDADIACHDTPEAAVRAFARLTEYRANQVQLMQVPPSRPPVSSIDTAKVAALIDAVLAQGRELLTEPEAKALLAACGVPVVSTRTCTASPLAAAQVANEMAAEHGWPLALKVLSPQISHKSDVGGVVLDLGSASAVANAAQAMLTRVVQARPDAVVSGFTLQPMVRRPRALELIVGTSIDPQFGPVLLFGQGGTAVEVVADRAIALPPLNAPLAHALIGRTRVARLLEGFRDVPPADTGAVVGVLTALSELLALEPRIAEIDINPLLADAQGVVALDARVRVSAAAPGGAARFAIQPYPAELAEAVDWQGSTLTLRPIRPEDEPQHRAFIDHLDATDLRMRFFYSRRTIERSELARLTQIDYAREMAFIATRPLQADALRGAPGAGEPTEETLGVVRALCDPDNEAAEFAVIVRSDLKGGGLGELLMRKLIAHLRQRGTRRVVGDVLKDNARMIQLARDLGFEVDAGHPDPDVVRVSLVL